MQVRSRDFSTKTEAMISPAKAVHTNAQLF
jgi:hypothetical protein